MTEMPCQSYDGPLAALSEEEVEVRNGLLGHVHALAGRIGPRHMWRPEALEAAARYIEESFAGLGYRVASQYYEVGSSSVRNLEAELRGSGSWGGIILVGAHYDTVPGSPGADDNASGVAALLEIARILSGGEYACTLRFVAFVNEEPPFFLTRRMGSRVYARLCRERDDRIIAALVCESIGCYCDAEGSQRYPFPFGLFYPSAANFIGFVGNLSSRRLVHEVVGLFRQHAAFPAQGAAVPGWVPGVAWSDQWSFWKEGYQAVMVTDTAFFRYPYYHTARDTADKVDFDRMARVVVGLARVVRGLAASAAVRPEGGP